MYDILLAQEHFFLIHKNRPNEEDIANIKEFAKNVTDTLTTKAEKDLKELIFDIENIIDEVDDEQLDKLLCDLSEIDYYNYTNK